MGLLDQILAGVGGTASGAADQMTMTEQLKQKRDQLQAQREADVNERLYRQDQLSRQEKRDADLREQSNHQFQLQSSRDAERERSDAARELRREGRDEVRDAQNEIANKRADAYLRLAVGRNGNTSTRQTADGTPGTLPAPVEAVYSGVKSRMGRDADVAKVASEVSRSADPGPVKTGAMAQATAALSRMQARADSAGGIEANAAAGYYKNPDAGSQMQKDLTTLVSARNKALVAAGADPAARASVEANFRAEAARINRKHFPSP